MLDKGESIDAFKLFDEWCRKIGIIMPKARFPVNFEETGPGIGADEDIKYREAFLSVPWKCVLSVSKARNHPILRKIIAEHPELFDEREELGCDQFALVLFLFYEIGRGKSSFWYAYLLAMPTVTFTCLWTEE